MIGVFETKGSNCRPQSRSTDPHPTPRRLYGHEGSLAPPDCAGSGLPGFHAEIKTHHWSGVTLSMKNMFGVVPGARYGWPKNILHWKGIQESILDLYATVPVHFVIADGIETMEGNGPLTALLVLLGRLLLRMTRSLPMQPVRA
jgi:hypothetical protein